MYCTRCGRKLPEGSTECPYCRQTAGGSQTAWTGAPAGQAAGRGPENQSAGSGGTKKRKGSAGKRVIVAAGILLLLAAVFGIAAVSYRVVARKQYEEQVSLGERYLEELDYEAAIAAFEEAIRIDPKREEAYLGLAEIYIMQGDYEEAEKILDDAYSVIHTESLKDRMTELEEERREAEEMRRAQQEEASEAEAMQEESRGEADKIPESQPMEEPESQSTAGQENQDGEILFYEHGEITLEGWLEEVQSEHIGGGFESTTYVLHLDQPAIFRVTDWDSEEEYETEIQDSVQVSYEVEGIEEAVGQHVQIRGEVEASQPTAYYIRDVAIYSGTCQILEEGANGNMDASDTGQIDVEAKVEEIREIYYGIQNNLGAMRAEDSGGGTIRYYDGANKIRKIIAMPGTYTYNGVYGAEEYTAEFYYDESEKLVFVFVYNGSDGSEYRFYMSDLTECIRYIDAQGTVMDYSQPVSPMEISEFGQYCELGMMEIAWAYGG